MKKYFSLLAMAAITATFGLTSCDDDDDAPELVPVETSDGVFVVNSGNKGSSIPGSLTYYDYGTGKAEQNVYMKANGLSLGITVNHAVVYGSKIYIVGTDEQTVFVADKKTLNKLANIAVEVNGESAKPRQAVAGNGHVYVSTYSNSVIAIDTLDYSIDPNPYQCGYYTEGMALSGNKLYTADSNYGSGDLGSSFPSISIIDLDTHETTTFRHEQINNPVDVKIVNGRIFILDSGSYDENWNQIGAGVYELAEGEVSKIADATEMAVTDNKIFVINAPYTTPVTDPTYKMFDTQTNSLTTFCDGDDIKYPGKISTDPTKGYVYITSYHMIGGFANYKVAGYCVIYNEDGAKVGEFDCGVGAGYVVPNNPVK